MNIPVVVKSTVKQSLALIPLTTLALNAFINSAEAALVLTYEAAGVQTTRAIGASTETFTNATTGSSFFSSALNGTYTPSDIRAANQYGGAGGTGNFFNVDANNPTFNTSTLTLNQKRAYFGMWWSAIDVNNTLTFYNDNTLIGTYTIGNILAGLPSSYYGNPNSNFSGQNTGEAYAYINFYSTNTANMFNRIVFSNASGTGFESDNHAVSSIIQTPTGTAVPEPLTIIGASVAVGFGTFFKRKLKKDKK